MITPIKNSKNFQIDSYSSEDFVMEVAAKAREGYQPVVGTVMVYGLTRSVVMEPVPATTPAKEKASGDVPAPKVAKKAKAKPAKEASDDKA